MKNVLAGSEFHTVKILHDKYYRYLNYLIDIFFNVKM